MSRTIPTIGGSRLVDRPSLEQAQISCADAPNVRRAPVGWRVRKADNRRDGPRIDSMANNRSPSSFRLRGEPRRPSQRSNRSCRGVGLPLCTDRTGIFQNTKNSPKSARKKCKFFSRRNFCPCPPVENRPAQPVNSVFGNRIIAGETPAAERPVAEINAPATRHFYGFMLHPTNRSSSKPDQSSVRATARSCWFCRALTGVVVSGLPAR